MAEQKDQLAKEVKGMARQQTSNPSKEINKPVTNQRKDKCSRINPGVRVQDEEEGVESR
jgi:hypothetical protein